MQTENLKVDISMTKQETQPRGLRNNNPGNIRNNNITYQGEVQPSQDGAFKTFTSMAYGYRAIFVLLHTYQRKHNLNTVEAMIARYAPANENHTRTYIDAVAEWSGVPATVRITTTNAEIMVPIVAAMSRVENGVPAVMADVELGWRIFISDYRNHRI